jgi:hypothetical protein
VESGRGGPDGERTAEWAAIEWRGRRYLGVTLPRADETPTSIEVPPVTDHLVLKLGRGDDSSPCLLLPGREMPELGATYVVLQPDVYHDDPTRGWVGVGGNFRDTVELGRASSQQLRLGSDVSRGHCTVTVTQLGVRVQDHSLNGTQVLLPVA